MIYDHFARHRVNANLWRIPLSYGGELYISAERVFIGQKRGKELDTLFVVADDVEMSFVGFQAIGGAVLSREKKEYYPPPLKGESEL